jgi:hypothetical protein
MSSLRVDSIQDIGGNPYNGIEYIGVDTKASFQMISGLTYHSTANSTTVTIGYPNNIANHDLTDPEVSAIMILQQHVHNQTGGYHGYLAGYYHQDGKDYADYGGYVSQSYYAAYYTVQGQTAIVPWDPAGTQQLNLYISSAFNTSASNTYEVYYLGHFRGK